MALVLTPVHLFRAGNKTYPRFEQLKAGEVLIQNRNGIDWVIARSGGASTKEAPIGLRGTWWRLARGTLYNDSVFFLHNDYDDHWSWEPARDMLLSAFVTALSALNPEFVRV